MFVNKRKTFLLITVLFCVFGCAYIDRSYVADYRPEHGFEQNVLPILKERCALTGCHVNGGSNADDIDFTSYETFLAGGEHGAVFIPGNATESEIIEEIVEGKMPPPDSGLPRVPAADLHVIIDWINVQ